MYSSDLTEALLKLTVAEREELAAALLDSLRSVEYPAEVIDLEATPAIDETEYRYTARATGR